MSVVEFLRHPVFGSLVLSTAPVLVGWLAVVLLRRRAPRLVRWLTRYLQRRTPREQAVILYSCITFLIAVGHAERLLLDYALQSDSSQYGFENCEVWEAAADSARGTAVAAPGCAKGGWRAKGDAAMSAKVHFDGTSEDPDAPTRKGELFVDVTAKRPRGFAEPITSLDLGGQTIQARVWVSRSLVSANRDQPTFLDLFVQDCDPPLARLGMADVAAQRVKDITMEGEVQLELAVPRDRTRVCFIGIKIGMNPKDRSTYQGELFVDAVT